MCNLQKKIEKGFEVFAYSIACHAWKVCIMCLLFNAFLGLGLMNIRSINNEELYLSSNSPTRKNMEMLINVFGEQNQTEFYAFQNIRPQTYVELIIWRKDNGNLIDSSLTGQISSILEHVKGLKVNLSSVITLSDVCSRRNGSCVIDGEDILEEIELKNKVAIEKPEFVENGQTIKSVANYTIKQNYINTAKFLRFRLYLQPSTQASLWTDNFIHEMKIFSLSGFGELSFVFTHSGSFFEELRKDPGNDIKYFSLVFTVYVAYFCFVLSGGNGLTNRSNIGRVGIIISPISIAGAWGALSFCHVMYTDISGIMPFFLVGHQSINVIITLSHVSDAVHLEDGKRRVSYAVQKSFVPITTTMLCYTLPFGVGVTSSFNVVKLVSIYTVTTLVFNYLNHFLLFTACIALHERRVDARRHYCICVKLSTTDDRYCCSSCCCSGSMATTRSDTESGIQRVFKKCMFLLLQTTLVKITAILSCIIIFAFSINGLINNAKCDIMQHNEVRPSSYFYEWNNIVKGNFEKELEVQVAVAHPNGFTDAWLIVSTLMETIKSQSSIIKNSSLLWYDLVPDNDKKSFNSEKKIFTYVRTQLINKYPFISNDLYLNVTGNKIIASRFYSRFKTSDTRSVANVQAFLADISDKFNRILEIKYKGLHHSVFPDKKFITFYSPDFILIDGFMQPLWEMVEFFAIQLIVLCVLSLLFSQSICNMLYSPFCYVAMITCILGLSTYHNVYICQVTMMFLLFSGCCCNEVIIHIGHSVHKNINEGIKEYYKKMSIALQNIGIIYLGLLLALLILLSASSFIFVSLFRITITATGICSLTSLLWLPTLLTFPCLPKTTYIKDDRTHSTTREGNTLSDIYHINLSENVESQCVSKENSLRGNNSFPLAETGKCMKSTSKQSRVDKNKVDVQCTMTNEHVSPNRHISIAGEPFDG